MNHNTYYTGTANDVLCMLCARMCLDGHVMYRREMICLHADIVDMVSFVLVQ